MRNKQFIAGVKAGISIAIGYFPVALTFGLLAKTTGLNIIEATAMSLFVFAGASQYMTLSLIKLGVDPVTIVINTFVVNIRHFLMTASLNEKMQRAPKWVKAAYAFGITDETFSILATREEEKITSAFAFGVASVAYGSWVTFTAVGHFVGANLPGFLQIAMSIALYAMFIGLLVPATKGNQKVVMLATTAAVIHGILYFGELLTTGWAILVSTLGSAIFIEIIYTRRGKNAAGMYKERKTN